jgi:hypothetical protein
MTDVLPALAQLSERLGRCPDLDTLVSAALGGLADLFGYEHSLLLLRDEDGSRLYTIASHGYDTEGIGSEIQVGEGIIGMAAAGFAHGNLGKMRHARASAARTAVWKPRVMVLRPRRSRANWRCDRARTTRRRLT